MKKLLIIITAFMLIFSSLVYAGGDKNRVGKTAGEETQEEGLSMKPSRASDTGASTSSLPDLSTTGIDAAREVFYLGLTTHIPIAFKVVAQPVNTS